MAYTLLSQEVGLALTRAELETAALLAQNSSPSGLSRSLGNLDPGDLEGLDRLVASGVVARDAKGLQIDPGIAEIVDVAARPSAVLRMVVTGTEASASVLFALRPQFGVRSVLDGDLAILTPFFTRDLLLRLALECGLSSQVRPQADLPPVTLAYSIAEECADLAADGNPQMAEELLTREGVNTLTADAFVAALASPRYVATVSNGQFSVAWLEDNHGSLWQAPVGGAALSSDFDIGVLSTFEVLVSVARLLPEGNEWQQVLVPVEQGYPK